MQLFYSHRDFPTGVSYFLAGKQGMVQNGCGVGKNSES